MDARAARPAASTRTSTAARAPACAPRSASSRTTRFSITPRVVYQTVRMDGWNRIDAYNILANPYTTSRPAVTLGERQLFTQIHEPFTDDFTLGDLNLRVRLRAGEPDVDHVVQLPRHPRRARRRRADVEHHRRQHRPAGGRLHAQRPARRRDARRTCCTQELRLAGGGEPRAVARRRLLQQQPARLRPERSTCPGFEAASGVPTQGLRAPQDVLFFSDLAYDLTQTAVFGEAT